MNAIHWVAVILICISTVAAEVYSCGGFVKSPDVSIDYSKIQASNNLISQQNSFLGMGF